MYLKELLSAISSPISYSRSVDETDITSLCHDSRIAGSGSVFVCKSGSVSDGHVYAPQAYKNGARVFIAEKKIELPSDALVCTVKSTADALCELAQKFYGYPARQLKIIGITGTKGKTTLALSVYQIGKEYGLKMGYIGTNGVMLGSHHESTKNTTPDVLELQRILRDMVCCGTEYVCLEVSSQALWQKRICGLSFFATVFTNLYPDHIGGVEHPSMDHYMMCKRSLFCDYASEHTVTNSDSPASVYMTSHISQDKLLSVSASADPSAALIAEDIESSRSDMSLGISFKCRGCGFDGEMIFVPSIGIYSVENALQVISLCRLMGIKKDFIAKSLSSLSVRGRCETVGLSSRPNTMFIIDYAHNGASLSSILCALREYTKNRIICVFGSVGGRTACRRQELAEAAMDHADVIIVTSDNPDSESPMSIIDDICSHMLGTQKPVYKLEDRAEAIRFAVSISQDGDTVLLAGKGHEQYQLIRGKRVPFSERDVLLSADIESPDQGQNKGKH